MSVSTRKITISLPEDLVHFADDEAQRRQISRSAVLAAALRLLARLEAERVAEDGYRYYATEAAEFARASLDATSESIHHGG